MKCESMHRDNAGRSVNLPAHFFVDRCQTLREAMAACKTQRDFLHELFTVCQHLTRQLVIMHRRKLVLRDICLRNVVRTNLGQVRSWTFLEYASAVRNGTPTCSMAVRTTPPSVRPFPSSPSCIVRFSVAHFNLFDSMTGRVISYLVSMAMFPVHRE
jgi:hypothetical protein